MNAIADPFNNDFHMDEQIEENPMDKELVAKELLKVAKLLSAKKISKEESKKMFKDVEKHIEQARNILHEMQDNMEDDGDNKNVRELRSKLYDVAVKIDHL